MSGFFTKLDHGIVGSTIWQAPSGTRLVWITMLAMSDQNGYVGASIPGLASIARVTLEEAVAAIESFLAPDPWSRSKEYEGRRIAAVEGGWVLLNHGKYKAKLDAELKRERSRIAMANLRESRKSESDAQKVTDDNNCQSYPIRLDIDNKEALVQQAAPSSERHDSRFDDFWQVYPLKRGRRPAQVKWKAKKLDKIADKLIEDVRTRIVSDKFWLDGYIPLASTYLNQERWEDDLKGREKSQQPANITGGSTKRPDNDASREEDRRLQIEQLESLGMYDEIKKLYPDYRK